MDSSGLAYRSYDRTQRQGWLASFATAAAAAIERLLAWQERAAQRRSLSELNDWALKDIGLSRADAEQEAGKPFWRI